MELFGLNLKLSSGRLAEIGPILRRFFINTLFDSTFTQLGVLIGSAFADNPDLRLVIGTLISSSIALGISTGVSVYESETLERERRTVELEKALFRKLDKTRLAETYRNYARLLALVNFVTPLICCAIIVMPIVAAFFNILDSSTASWISIILAMAILFTAGVYFGRYGKQNPLRKGLRMVGFGIVAFAAGYLIQILL
jgi:predicted membrane protein (TIGR00267 family)